VGATPSGEGNAAGIGTLYVVATPLGNLGDLSPRAADVLRAVDLIAAEDTRRVARLLAHLKVNRPTTSFHSYSSEDKLRGLVERLARGQKVALVSDAGTPCISDPGAELVAAAWEIGAPVVPVPGPCAAVAALAASGFPAGRFLFAGYVPRHASQRREFLAGMLRQPWPVVLYEAPGRVATLLADLALLAQPDRQVLVGRELTKLHEEMLRGKVGDVAAAWEDATARGEVTVVIAPGQQAAAEAGAAEASALAAWLAREGLPPGRIAAALTRLCGLSRAEAYEKAQAAARAERPRL